MMAAGDVDDFTPDVRLSVAQAVADSAGVDVDAVTITVSSGSVVILAEIQAEDMTAAAAAQSNIASDFSTPEAATVALAAGGIVVTSTPVVKTVAENLIAYPPPPPSPPPSQLSTPLSGASPSLPSATSASAGAPLIYALVIGVGVLTVVAVIICAAFKHRKLCFRRSPIVPQADRAPWGTVRGERMPERQACLVGTERLERLPDTPQRI